MAWQVTKLAYEVDLPRSEKAVLLAMAEHADPNGREVFVGTARLIEKTKYSRRAVQYARKQLLERGLISITRPPTYEGDPTHYRINMGRLRALAPGADSAAGASSAHPGATTAPKPSGNQEKGSGAKSAPGATTAPGGCLHVWGEIPQEHLRVCSLCLLEEPLSEVIADAS